MSDLGPQRGAKRALIRSLSAILFDIVPTQFPLCDPRINLGGPLAVAGLKTSVKRGCTK